MNKNNQNNMKQIVAAVERGKGDGKQTFWTRVGAAFEMGTGPGTADWPTTTRIPGRRCS
jgi:hypothetical protein